jgi:hypothetical protein
MGGQYTPGQSPIELFIENVKTMVSGIDWAALVSAIKDFALAFSSIDWKKFGEAAVEITNLTIALAGATAFFFRPAEATTYKYISPYEGMNEYQQMWQGVYDTTVEKSGATLTETEGFKGDFVKQWEDLYNDVIGRSIVPDMMTGIYDEITGKMTDVNVNLATSINGAGGIVAKFTDLAEGIKPAVTWTNNLYGALDRLATLLLSNRFDEAMAALAGLMGSSPSPLAVGLQTAAQAMRNLTMNELPRLAAYSATPVSAPATVTAPVYSNSVNMTWGDTYVSNGMDAAMLRAMVQQAVNGAMAM